MVFRAMNTFELLKQPSMLALKLSLQTLQNVLPPPPKLRKYEYAA
jgi:hypothetical protein